MKRVWLRHLTRRQLGGCGLALAAGAALGTSRVLAAPPIPIDQRIREIKRGEFIFSYGPETTIKRDEKGLEAAYAAQDRSATYLVQLLTAMRGAHPALKAAADDFVWSNANRRKPRTKGTVTNPATPPSWDRTRIGIIIASDWEYTATLANGNWRLQFVDGIWADKNRFVHSLDHIVPFADEGKVSVDQIDTLLSAFVSFEMSRRRREQTRPLAGVDFSTGDEGFADALGLEAQLRSADARTGLYTEAFARAVAIYADYQASPFPGIADSDRWQQAVAAWQSLASDGTSDPDPNALEARVLAAGFVGLVAPPLMSQLSCLRRLPM